MNLLGNAIINGYSVILLIIVGIYLWQYTQLESLKDKLYLVMLNVTILTLIIDILGRFDGNSKSYYPIINHVGNFLVFLFSLALPSIWLLYVYFHFFQEIKRPKLFSRIVLMILGLNCMNLFLIIGTQFYGWYYAIDVNNIYQRGPLFIVCEFMALILMSAAFGVIVFNRRTIDKKAYYSLLFFQFPPFIALILQNFIYGVSLMLNSVVLSLLIVFLNIQNHSINMDYLTGVYNRRKLESYLQERISKSTAEKTFSAILIDIDDFKNINDTFGHNTGDAALETSARLIKKSLRSDDFIARFGGDEFCAIVDISDALNLEVLINDIKERLQKYNDSSAEPYKIKFSMGYAVYDYDAHMSMADFHEHIDAMMYENKRINKAKAKMMNGA